MKKLLGSLAILSLLGTAAPALASDVVQYRYLPSRERIGQAPATETASAQPERAAEPAKAPCACDCAKGGSHAHAHHEKAST